MHHVRVCTNAVSKIETLNHFRRYDAEQYTSLPSPLFLLLKVILSVVWICIGLRFYMIVVPAYRMSALVSVPVACDTYTYTCEYFEDSNG